MLFAILLYKFYAHEEDDVVMLNLSRILPDFEYFRLSYQPYDTDMVRSLLIICDHIHWLQMSQYCRFEPQT